MNRAAAFLLLACLLAGQASQPAALASPILDIAPIDGTTLRVSVASDGAQANDLSGDSKISADGRFVTFWSKASNLVISDTNRQYDVFVRDLQKNTTQRVSVSSSGGQGNGLSWHPSISADGRYVAFESGASNLVISDTNLMADIFVRDLLTGVTGLVSIGSDGKTRGNGSSSEPAISADGRFVAFTSLAWNLASNSTNGAQQIYVHDRQTGVTERVSVTDSSVNGDSHSKSPSISAGGRYVAFSSSARNLVPNDTNNDWDVFVYDRQSHTIQRASVASDGTQAINDSIRPVISSNGKFVAFESNAFNLVSHDSNNKADVFVRDLQAGVTERVSVDERGQQQLFESGEPSISADGRFVVYYYATNTFMGNWKDLTNIFRRDCQDELTERVSQPDGEMVGDAISESPSISAHGQRISFTSSAANLVISDTNGVEDIFVFIPNPPRHLYMVYLSK